MAAWIGTSGWSYDHWHPELYPPGLPARDRLARYTAGLHHRRAEQQLLPLAVAGGVRQLAAPPAGRLPALGQGAARPDSRAQAVRAGDLAGAHRGGLARAGRPPGGAAGAAAARPGPRRYEAGLLPRAGPGLDARRGGVPAPELAPRGSLRAARRAPRGLLRDERRQPAVRAARHHRLRLRPDARPGRQAPVRGLLPGRRPALVGERIGEWNRAGQDVFVYFNNDGEANAVRNARTLRALLDE